MSNDQIADDDTQFGSVALVSDHAEVTAKRYWMRGDWWDYLHGFWDELVAEGRLSDVDDEAPGERLPTGSLALQGELAPGECKEYRFILTWHFPNRPDTWDLRTLGRLGIDEADVGTTRNQYATRFADAWDVGAYVSRHRARLDEGTKRFPRSPVQQHLARCRAGRGLRQYRAPAQHHLLLARGWEFLWLGGLQRRVWLLPGQLHARLELCLYARLSVPVAGARDAADRVQCGDGRRWLHALSLLRHFPSGIRLGRPHRRGGRRADGLHPARLSRVAFERGR